MQHSVRSKKKKNYPGALRNKILPIAFVVFSCVLMALPLERPMYSVKVLLSYIFIPQIRAAHGSVEYIADVWDTVKELLDAHHENEHLKTLLQQIQLERVQAQEIFAENTRLTQALQLKAPKKWEGIWAKTTYRDPNQWNSVMINKGLADGVQERSAVLTQHNGKPILAGVVVEVNEHAAKVLLLRDEDFSAVVYVHGSGEEALLSGAGMADLKMQYLPLLSTIQKGTEVYTSSGSSIFPAGILVGKVSAVEKGQDLYSSLTARVIPAADAASIRELFILTLKEGETAHADRY